MNALNLGRKTVLKVYGIIDKNPGISKQRITESGISLSTVSRAVDFLIDGGIIAAYNAGVKSAPIAFSAINDDTVYVADVSGSCFAYAEVSRGKAPEILSRHYRSDALSLHENVHEFLSNSHFDSDFALILPHGLSEDAINALLGCFPTPPSFITERNAAAANGILYDSRNARSKISAYLQIGSTPFAAVNGLNLPNGLLETANPGLALCGNFQTVSEIYTSAVDTDGIITATVTGICALTAFFSPDTLTLYSEEFRISESDVNRMQRLIEASLPPDIPNCGNPVPRIIAARWNPLLIGSAGLFRRAKLAKLLEADEIRICRRILTLS